MAKARKIRGLEPTMPFRLAAERIVVARYGEMAPYQSAAASGADADAVHDMRVACKRMREAISALRDAWDPKQLRGLRRDVESLNDAMGQVREGDVFLAWLGDRTKDLPEDDPARLAAAEVAHGTEIVRREQLDDMRDLFTELLPARLSADITSIVAGARRRGGKRRG